MASQGKEVIYIDIDDEITVIIDKVRTAEARIIALVLPKRATVFQSSVNMKLLKRAAAEDKKQLVLITSENNLLPLAGSIGLYVAKDLQSKPEIPTFSDTSAADNAIDTLEEPDVDEDFDKTAAAEQPVGELAGLPGVTVKAKPELTPLPIPRAEETDDTIELDNTPVPADTAETGGETKKEKKAKDKNLKVPNFNKFRNRLIIAVVILILLIVGWILANIILPKANIIVTTQTSSVNSNLTLTLSTSASTVSQANLTVPAHSQQLQKTNTQTVNTTGQKNNGSPANGYVTVTEDTSENFYSGCAQPATIPAGTSITDTNSNINFIISPDAATFSPSGVGKGNGNNQCAYTSNKIPVVAQNPGELNSSLPTSSDSFTVNDSSVSATANADGNFTDGTNNIVQIVTQADINNATSKLTAPDTSSIKTELQNDLIQAGYYPISATFSAGTTTTTDSANVGAQANTVSVTQTSPYTMFGVRKSDIQPLLDNYIDSQIDTSKQSIINDGLNQAVFSVLNQSASSDQVSIQATATIGPNLSIAALKAQVAGKKTGQVESLISSDPGVTNVQVNLSPFWVSSVPTKTSKITIKLQNISNASKH
jgi:hypothetical protein